MTKTIQYAVELATGECGFDEFILLAEVDMVRGVQELDLVEIHNTETGEMFEMGDWEAMLNDYGDDWEADGVLCWRELQDLVAEKGE